MSSEKRVFLAPAMLAGIFACSDSGVLGGFTETFRASDTVADSIFESLSDNAAQEGEFRLTVVSSGVSSGFVKLNDEDLMAPHDFHNKSFEKTMEVTLFAENKVAVEVRGKPGDQLCVRVFEVHPDDTERGIYERCVDREAGPPNSVEVVITPTPAPGG